MQWLIIRITTGEKFLCEVSGNIAECVKHASPVQVKNLLEIQTVNIQVGQGVRRLTKLAEIDFCIGEEKVTPLESMHVIIAAWYKPSEELVKEMLADIDAAKKASIEMAKQMESQLTQVQAVPMGQGMPRMPPGMGGSGRR
jgi:hypothetical protein